MPRVEITKADLLKGIGPDCQDLFEALWRGKHLTENVKFSLAQYGASCGANRLNGESLLLCVLSDWMATAEGRQQLRDHYPTPF